MFSKPRTKLKSKDSAIAGALWYRVLSGRLPRTSLFDVLFVLHILTSVAFGWPQPCSRHAAEGLVLSECSAFGANYAVTSLAIVALTSLIPPQPRPNSGFSKSG
jgi:hypothetical protein